MKIGYTINNSIILNVLNGIKDDEIKYIEGNTLFF